MQVKLISLDEANRMLPLIKSIMSDIQKCWPKAVEAKTFGDKERYDELSVKFVAYAREMDELGVFIQDFKRGIISIPSLYHGRKVFLSWCVIDDEICHWHELDETYEDRIRIKCTEEFNWPQPEESYS